MNDQTPMINAQDGTAVQAVMTQAMPGRDDLTKVRDVSERTAAGFEILLSHYRQQQEELKRLTALIRNVIEGHWSVTDLQEAIGDV